MKGHWSVSWHTLEMGDHQGLVSCHYGNSLVTLTYFPMSNYTILNYIKVRTYVLDILVTHKMGHSSCNLRLLFINLEGLVNWSVYLNAGLDVQSGWNALLKCWMNVWPWRYTLEMLVECLAMRAQTWMLVKCLDMSVDYWNVGRMSGHECTVMKCWLNVWPWG